MPASFAMVDGCFDPLHRGHVEYFRFAATLGVPVLCNVAADAYLISHKGRPPLLGESDRAGVIDGMRSIDYVYIARSGTRSSLERLRPAYYVKGKDWVGRLPEEQIDACRRLGIKIVYADCQLGSSSGIIDHFLRSLGHHGEGRLTSTPCEDKDGFREAGRGCARA
ncbi:MAG TPA: hypothetical protein VMT52_08495 [Planctomycetota bacterium]|nr:hypothetical protein [Planctomycetota bacterium]